MKARRSPNANASIHMHKGLFQPAYLFRVRPNCIAQALLRPRREPKMPLTKHSRDSREEKPMKRSESSAGPIPQHDYGVALKSAVSWLGDRYLLAEPLTKRRDEPKDYFAQTPRWQDRVSNIR